MVLQLRESGDLVGEPRPIMHNVKFYEKGDRPLEILTSRQWFIKTMDFREQLLARGRHLEWHPPYMQRVSKTGQRPERRPGAPVGSGSSAWRFRSGTPWTGRVASITGGPLLPTHDRAADPSSTNTPPGYRSGPAWRAEWLRRRSRHDGHLGDLVADAADRVRLAGLFGSIREDVPDGSPPAGPRHHPHLVLRYRSSIRARARPVAVEARGHLRMGSRSPSEKDVQVERQRRHAHGAARGARVGWRPLLGGEGIPGHRHGVRSEADEGRAAGGDQDLNASKFVLGAALDSVPNPARRSLLSRPSIARC